MAASDAIAVLAGAGIGGLAAVSASWLQARTARKADIRRYEYEEERRQQENEAASERARRAITRRYLFQLQESVESLRRRIVNWASRGDKLVSESDPGYWEVTTLYAFGRALAAERILSLEGAYADVSGDLRSFLMTHTVDGAIASVLGQEFLFYHRLTLAEAMLEREPNGYRLIVFSEFRQRFDDPAWGLQDALSSAVNPLRGFTHSNMSQMAEVLEELAERLEKETQVSLQYIHS
jgi:hypothetical protein